MDNGISEDNEVLGQKVCTTHTIRNYHHYYYYCCDDGHFISIKLFVNMVCMFCPDVNAQMVIVGAALMTAWQNDDRRQALNE